MFGPREVGSKVQRFLGDAGVPAAAGLSEALFGQARRAVAPRFVVGDLAAMTPQRQGELAFTVTFRFSCQRSFMITTQMGQG